MTHEQFNPIFKLKTLQYNVAKYIKSDRIMSNDQYINSPVLTQGNKTANTEIIIKCLVQLIL